MHPVVLSNEMEITVFISSKEHNLQKFFNILIQGGRASFVL
ncbi:24270_t:CDS:1, partial [Gigaspora margarita]